MRSLGDDEEAARRDDTGEPMPEPMINTARDPLSTFAIDVDTASYTQARSHLRAGRLPPADTVRIEEFVNYFRYDYPGPDRADDRPFAVHMHAAPSPLHPGRHLLRVGVQARRLSAAERKPVHLVFLVDVSGSMAGPERLGLVRQSLNILTDNLRDGDTVALVTYADGSRVVLPPTGVSGRHRIRAAIEKLTADGGTAMSDGMKRAYALAARGVRPGAVSRVIVLSDGDANIGNDRYEDILSDIRAQVDAGVTLSTIGFGMGNYRDDMMERLADNGNGNNYYIDTPAEARRVFHEQIDGTLEVVAKDVKIQVEFDPKVVSRYRLLGYENRAIADDEFRDDTVDAGEIGAGHAVTALYELALADGAGAADGDVATVRVRAKTPRGTRAKETVYALPRRAVAVRYADTPESLRLAVAAAEVALLLRATPRVALSRHPQVSLLAKAAARESSDPASRELPELLERMPGPLTLANETPPHIEDARIRARRHGL
jgi:Ca-activated chloride channel family protein